MAKPNLPTSVPEIVELLQRFNERATKLYEFSFHRQATAPGNGSRIQFIPEFKAEYRGADAESTSAVLLELRLLVQPRDLISFEQIVEMHEVLPISVEQKRESRVTLSALQEYLSTGCRAEFADWPITRAELFDVFMYGRDVHNNSDKAAKVRRLNDSRVAVLYHEDYADIVLEYIRYANWYKAFNEKIIQSLAASGGG